MAKVELYSLVDIKDVLDAAFRHPTLAIKPRSKKLPDLDTALKAVLKSIELAVIEHVASEVQAKLQDAYDMHVIMDGDYADLTEPKQRDEWTSAVDDIVEAEIEPYVEFLSHNWLGVNTVDSGLHEEDGIKKFAYKLGAEYFKELTYGKNPGQIMSNAGIVQADVERRLEEHLTPKTEKELETMSNEENNELDAVMAKVAAHVGKDYNVMTVYDDLELASDEDDILAVGAAARIGLDTDDVPVLQGERMIHGDDVTDMLHQKLDAILTAKPVKKAPATSKPKLEAPATPKIVTAAKQPKNVDTADSEGEFDPKVLETLRECGANDQEMGKSMGVSRATYSNYVTGKSAFTPSFDQHNMIRDEIVFRLNKLHEALAVMDSTDAVVVE